MTPRHEIIDKTPSRLGRSLVAHTNRLVTAMNTGYVAEFNKGLGEQVRLASRQADFALKGRRFVANELKRHIHGMHQDKSFKVHAVLGEVRFKGEDGYPCVFVYEGGAPAGAICLEIERASKKVKSVHILTDASTISSMSRTPSSQAGPVLMSA